MRTLSADGRPIPDDVTRAGLAREEAHWKHHGFGLWLFRTRRDGTFIGRAGLKRYELPGGTRIALAYAVLSPHWNLGHATEMAGASLRVGFEYLGLPEVASWTLPHDERSRRVLARLGFRCEGEYLSRRRRTCTTAWVARTGKPCGRSVSSRRPSSAGRLKTPIASAARCRGSSLPPATASPMPNPFFRARPALRGEWSPYRRAPRPPGPAGVRAGLPAPYLPRTLLRVPHRAQESVAGAVPACVAMVLAARREVAGEEELAELLGTDPLYGTPGRRLDRLGAWGWRAHYPAELQRFRDGALELNHRLGAGTARLVYHWEAAWLRAVGAALAEGMPAVLFVDLGTLSRRWRGFRQHHAVVLAGGDGRHAWIHDPAMEYGPTRCGLGRLMDALLPGEPLAAFLSPGPG